MARRIMVKYFKITVEKYIFVGIKQPVYINDMEDNEEDLETPTGENQFSSMQVI